MSKKELLKTAFIKSLPVMCSYVFVAIAYGIMMEESGLAWYYSLLTSAAVYTGAFQFAHMKILLTIQNKILVSYHRNFRK